MTLPHHTLNLPKSLGAGLVLRLAGPADIEAVAALNERVLLEEDEPAGIFAAWTRDLLSGRHPTTTAADCVLVEDTTTRQVVSSTTLIPQVWRYEDIPFDVGRPELVATDRAYRRRGLVRAIFEAAHALSAAYGHHVQIITGIRWFYRQFGYEYALPLERGRTFNIDDTPALKDGQAEPYQTRPAMAADIPTIVRLYERQCAGKLVTSVIDEAHWQYDLFGLSPASAKAIQAHCLTNKVGDIVGYYTMSPHIWNSSARVWELAVAEGISLYTVLPSLLRALKRQGEALAMVAKPTQETLKFIHFALGAEHPLYEALETKLWLSSLPYALYIRVADLPRFIRHIAPVLERRLANSVMYGYSGQLKLDFYRGGLRLAFEEGQLTEAVDWQAPDTDQHWQGAGFPPLVFLQLLFGYRSLDELRYAFPDCWAGDEAALLLKILFPKRVSWVLPLG